MDRSIARVTKTCPFKQSPFVISSGTPVQTRETGTGSLSVRAEQPPSRRHRAASPRRRRGRPVRGRLKTARFSTRGAGPERKRVEKTSAFGRARRQRPRERGKSRSTPPTGNQLLAGSRRVRTSVAPLSDERITFAVVSKIHDSGGSHSSNGARF